MWEAGFLELVLFLYIYIDSRIELWSSDLQIKHFYPLNHLIGLEHNFGVKKTKQNKKQNYITSYSAWTLLILLLKYEEWETTGGPVSFQFE